MQIDIKVLTLVPGRWQNERGSSLGKSFGTEEQDHSALSSPFTWIVGCQELVPSAELKHLLAKINGKEPKYTL